MPDFDAVSGISKRQVLASAVDAGSGIPRTAAAKQRDLRKEAMQDVASHVSGFISPVVVAGVLRILEAVLIALTGFVLYLTYIYPAEGWFWSYPAVAVTTALTAVLTFQIAGLYRMQALRAFLVNNIRLVLIWAGLFASLAVLAFFLKVGEEFSRVWFASWAFAGLSSIIAARLIAAPMVRNWTVEGRLDRRTVIVGGGKRAEDLIGALEASAAKDVSICGLFDDRKDERSPSNVAGYQKLGTVDELVEFARRSRVDLLIVALPITAETRLLQMLKKLWVLPVDIRLSAHTNRLRFRPRSYSYIGNVPLLDVFDRPLADWDYVIKWIFDKAVAGLGLLLFSPVMLVTALAIKLDSKGPVFFRQKRYGFNNELIEVWKFRSMHTGQCDATASKLVTKNDPRVTRVGRFIRRTSIDELPQFFNVLTGELSLVGPRPHALSAKAANRLYEEVVDGYFARHRVKPGITGWAQINGWRGETDTSDKIQRRVEHDLYYIENWSVFFDIYILAMTPFSLLNGENAY